MRIHYNWSELLSSNRSAPFILCFLNVAMAVLRRGARDAKEPAQLDQATDRGFAKLPYHDRWLNDWNYV